MKVVLALIAFLVTGSGAIANTGLHGARSSFLTGIPGDWESWKQPGGMSFMYLSDGFQDREGYRQRLLNNGDTHIDIYARAKQPAFDGLTIDGYANHRNTLQELNNAGLKPVAWLTPEGRRGDYKDSPAEQERFFNHFIKTNDDLVAGYVVTLEGDEYWDPDTVTHLVNVAKSLTDKPVAIHLTPGYGGHSGDARYYRNVDYVYLQLGFDKTPEEVAAIVAEAVKHGIPVIASEYNLGSESAAARAQGDAACAAGAVGTGNGRTVTLCGQTMGRVEKEEEWYEEYDWEIGTLIVSAVAGYIAYRIWWADKPEDEMEKLNFNLQMQDENYMAGMQFQATERTSVGIEFSDNRSMGFINLRF